MRPHAASIALLVALATGGCGGTASDSQSGPATAATPPASAADEPSRSSASQEPTPGQEQEQGAERSVGPTAPGGARLAPLGGSEPAVRWTPSGFEVRAFGSSSCPPTAASVRRLAPSRVVIEMDSAGGPACTDDLAPHNSFVPAPAGLSRDRPLEVRLNDGGALSEPIDVEFLDNTLL